MASDFLEPARHSHVACGVQSEISILRVHFQEHNRSVLFASAATLAFAVIGWLVIYAMFYWFTVAFLSVKEGLKFTGTLNFNRNFFSSVAVLYVATLVDRWVFRYSPEAVDRRPLSETLLDIALFLPRMTLAVLENFTVWISLHKSELREAARLVELVREWGRFPLHEVPVIIPNKRKRERILAALRVSQIIDVRPADGIAWLHIGCLAPPELAPAIQPARSPEILRRSSAALAAREMSNDVPRLKL